MRRRGRFRSRRRVGYRGRRARGNFHTRRGRLRRGRARYIGFRM